jgi:hypothetical protein
MQIEVGARGMRAEIRLNDAFGVVKKWNRSEVTGRQPEAEFGVHVCKPQGQRREERGFSEEGRRSSDTQG